MTAPLTVYVAPTSQGTGDGLTAANAKGMDTTAGRDWLATTMRAWKTEVDGNTADVGLNEAHTINTVTAGFEPGYFDANPSTGAFDVPVKSYVTDARHGLWVRRVCWLSDVGDYTITGNSSTTWFTIGADMTPAIPAAADAGTTAPKAIRRFHLVAYRTADGQRADQVVGATETRTVSIPAKTGATSTWADPAQYVASGSLVKWNGATASASKTWTVQLPSPVRAVFRGSRSPDPRPADKKRIQQWCVANGTRLFELKDPTGTGTEPSYLDASGNRRLIAAGQVWDPETQTMIQSGTYTNIGPMVFTFTASCVGVQGFEFRNVERPYQTQWSTKLTRWTSFLDHRLDNTRYLNFRGDYKQDVEIARLHATAVSQKMLVPGQNCQRWHISNVYSDGQLVVGDRIQSLIGAANGPTGTETAYNSGAFRWENIIAEYMWDAVPEGSTYMQGDGIDAEIKGHTVRNYWCDMSGDGGIDTKPTPYWVNWPAVLIVNAYLSRNKRALRSWPGAQDKTAVAPTVLRDVTVADARQYGLFMVGTPGHHKHVDWWNPDGRANWTNPAGRTYTAVSNDNTVAGDMDAVVRQPYDARTAGAYTSGMNSNTVRGVTAAPFRARTWTPVTAPRPLVVAVNGSTADDGEAVAVTNGQAVTFAPSTQPVGTTIAYTVSGRATVTRTGDNATVTATLA